MKKNLIIVATLAILIVIGFVLLNDIGIPGETPKAPPPINAQAPLEYTKIDFDDPIAKTNLSHAIGNWKKPETVTKLPTDIGDTKLLYFEVPVHNTKVIFAGLPGDKPKLYVDTNNNGDLSDDKPFEAVKIESQAFFTPKFYYGPIDITMGQGDQPKTTASLYVASYGRNYISIHPASYLAGEIKLGDQSYKVGLLDNNKDGKYNLPIKKNGRQNDKMVLDRDQDSQFTQYGGSFAVSEVMDIPEMLKIADTYYKVTLTTNGKSLQMKQFQPKMGFVIISDKNLKLAVVAVGSQANQYVIDGSKEKNTLPIDEYFVTAFQLEKKDDNGDKWTMEARGHGSNQDIFKVLEGQTVTIKAGQPLALRAEVNFHKTGMIFKSKVASIDPKLIGQTGETYGLNVLKNDEPVGETPKLTIYDENEKELVTGQFEYGWGGTCSYSWRVPKEFKGKYRIEIKTNLGPFEIKQEKEWFTAEKKKT